MRFILLVCLSIFTGSVYADGRVIRLIHPGNDTTKVVASKTLMPSTTSVAAKRNQQLNNLLPADFNNESSTLYQNDFVALPAPADSVNKMIERAKALFKQVKDEQRYVKYLDATALLELPIGLVGDNNGNEDYAIIIDSLVITPTYAYLTAYMAIPIPQSDESLVFRATNIRFTNNGGLSGDAKLMLLKDTEVKMFGANSRMILRGQETFANWDCNGFKNMNLSAQIEFSRNFLLPKEGDGKVTGRFSAYVDEWKDLVATVDLDPFRIPQLPDFEFIAKQAVFDYSDTYNAPGVQFPSNYKSPQFIGESKELWRGFYMEELSVILPKEFQKRSDDKRISFTGYNLIIDNQGFSGKVEAKNLFVMQEGDMDGWSYSLDSLAVNFLQGDLQGAGFKGGIVIPIAEENKPFAYDATINPGESSYLFKVTSLDKLKFDFWKANVLLQEGSYLDISVVKGKFRPKAVLTGSMDIASTTDDMSLLGVKFEELQIMTVSPYLDAKAFSFGSEKLESSLKSFPVSISKIGLMEKADGRKALTFNIAVHLTGQNDGAYGGDATFEILASRNETSRRWKYDGLRISEIGIDIDGGSYKIKGRIKMFEDDLIYGKGFNGTVQLFFKPGFEVAGTVLFGKTSGYRYWYADAFVGLPTGIPFIGFFSFYGFGGGMYHNMEQVGYSQDEKYSAGKSLSGVIYKPNNEVRYGLKATVQIGLTSSKETFNGDVTFEISFNAGGGIRRISLIGNGYVFTSADFGDLQVLAEQVGKMSEQKAEYGYKQGEDDIMTSDLRPPDKSALISGHVFQYYDFENNVMHGEMEMYVDVFGVLTGTGPNGMAGWSVIHYSPEEWYIFIGSPDRRVGLSVLGLFKMQGYFMTGTNIPGSPPPPENVSRILRATDLDYMRDENALGLGKGVAFGSSFSFDTGDKTFLMFYGRFAMGAGFDVMLKNYGNEVRCKGSSSKLGINGWYANGQAYAYVEGSIGIKFKIFGSKKKKEILKLGAAVLFQAKLPNPFWMKGVVGGYYSILGGLIKGHCKFQLEIGDECEIVNGSVLEGLAVISGISPEGYSKEVSVFTTPQAVFNMEVDRVFEMVDVDDKKKSFRIKLDHFTVKVKDEEKVIPASLVWNTDHTVLAFDNIETLPPEKELEAEVQISFEEAEGQSWKPVKVSGKEVTEVLTQTFFTGSAPDYIPFENVAYSYPQWNQYNFYKSEYPGGYIKLKKGQSYLFDQSGKWLQKAKLTAATGESYPVDISYTDLQITFGMPSQLMNDRIYSLEIINTPVQQGGELDRNIVAVSQQVEMGGQKTDTEIVSRKAEGSIETLQETVIYKSYFRASKYNSFREKLKKMNISSGWILPDSRAQSSHILGNTVFADEYFDKSELVGINQDRPLVSIIANLSTNDYYNKLIYPLLYEDYGSLTVPAAKLSMRDLSLGVPPVHAVFIRQSPTVFLELTDSDIIQGSVFNPIQGANFTYELSYYMRTDYQDLQAQTARYYISTGTALTNRRRLILETPFPTATKGNYQIDITYTLPGINKVTTRESVIIKNPF